MGKTRQYCFACKFLLVRHVCMFSVCLVFSCSGRYFSCLFRLFAFFHVCLSKNFKRYESLSVNVKLLFLAFCPENLRPTSSIYTPITEARRQEFPS